MNVIFSFSHYYINHVMSTFTVDGVTSMKKREMEQGMAEQKSEQFQAELTKQFHKSNEMSMKKMAQEKERQSKFEEQKLFRLIQMKVERRFGAFPWLREKIPPLSSKPNLAELQETDELQRLELDLQGSEQRLMGFIAQGGQILETLWGDGRHATFLPPKFRLNLTDIGAVLNSPIFMKEAEPLITETVIEYPTFGQMGLGMRWASCVIQCMMTVHQMNTNPKFKEMFMKAALSEDELSEGSPNSECEEAYVEPPKK
jgi:hypothetical protein